MCDKFDAIEEWNSAELTDDELSQLKEDVFHEIRYKNRVDLVPLHGHLHFKDKLFFCKVKRLTPSMKLFNSLEPSIASLTLYVVEGDHKIIEEMKAYGPAAWPEMEVWVSVYIMSSISNIGDNAGVLQSFGKYITSVYGKFIDHSSLERPVRFAMDGVLKQAMFAESESIFASLWPTSVETFMVVLRGPEFLTDEDFQHPDYEIREISLEEALFAADNWMYRRKGSEYRFASSYSLGLAVGAFPLGSSSPVSWAICNWDGAISALHTFPEHRRKGLGKAVVKRLASRMILNGSIPFSFVVNGIVTSESIFASLGFDVHKDVWFYICLSFDLPHLNQK